MKLVKPIIGYADQIAWFSIFNRELSPTAFDKVVKPTVGAAVSVGRVKEAIALPVKLDMPTK